LSDPCVNFVFEEGGPHAGSRLVGVWTKLWRRTLEGRGSVRGVKLRAGAVRAFVNDSAFRFVNRIVPLSSVFGPDVGELERAVLGPHEDDEGFAALERWLIARRLRAGNGQLELAIALVDRIAAARDITSVERLASVAGLGQRALQRLFREHVGASPKWV